jgi:hypothetical protein
MGVLRWVDGRLGGLNRARPVRVDARRLPVTPSPRARLSFRELALIYKSLQAAKTLGALPPQDELLNDTIQLIDQALNRTA